MTGTSKESFLSESVKGYIKREQAHFLAAVELAWEQKRITEMYYHHALTKHCGAGQWDDVHEYFYLLYRDFIEQMTHYEYYSILERMHKGIEWMEEEGRTPEEKKRGMNLYNGLEQQAMKLKGAIQL